MLTVTDGAIAVGGVGAVGSGERRWFSAGFMRGQEGLVRPLEWDRELHGVGLLVLVWYRLQASVEMEGLTEDGQESGCDTSPKWAWRSSPGA